MTSIEKLQAALAAADAEATATTSLDDAVKMLIALNRHRDQIKLIYEELSKKVSDLMGTESEYFAPQGVKIEKKWSKSRTSWQHQELAREVAERIYLSNIDPDTGEMKLETEDLIASLLTFVSPSYWRVTPLRAIDINPDDWCESGEAKPSIIVRNAKEL